jgi:hypothetical protein
MKQSSGENLLEEDHAELGELIAQLFVALDARDVEMSFARLDLVWARLAVHIRAEHLGLFPTILDAARRVSKREDGTPRFCEVESTINELRRDHDFLMDELARAVNTMREITGSENSSVTEERLRDVWRRVTLVDERLDKHNRIEEEQVYGWPAALLSSTEQAQLAERVRRELGNMPPRFTGSP